MYPKLLSDRREAKSRAEKEKYVDAVWCKACAEEAGRCRTGQKKQAYPE